MVEFCLYLEQVRPLCEQRPLKASEAEWFVSVFGDLVMTLPCSVYIVHAAPRSFERLATATFKEAFASKICGT